MKGVGLHGSSFRYRWINRERFVAWVGRQPDDVTTVCARQLYIRSLAQITGRRKESEVVNNMVDSRQGAKAQRAQTCLAALRLGVKIAFHYRLAQ
ncbi:MAG: hypothetical protein KC423_29710 [Anaerolineales bacterium]|nr:hypothetical protein [Anaerolineales bacterium]